MRKKILYLLLIAISLVHVTYASEEPNWSVSLIPAELKLKSNAVIRNFETILTISANGKVEEFVKIATTILNENGERFSYLVESYDKFSSISGLDGVVYDKTGKKIRKIKADEFLDVSAIAGFSIYDDNRLKVANPKVGDYPYTVVYEYTKKHKSFFAIPGWQIYPSYNVSVQKSSYKIILEKGAKISLKGNEKFALTPTIIEGVESKSYLWSIENLPIIEQEPFSGAFTDVTPILYVAPERFVMDDYEGSNSSWSDLGNWAHNLGRNKNILPEQTKEKIKNLLLDASSDIEKAKRLYEYLQNKVRYVSIQMGIGGYQPFPAETVDRLSYGDCKALANYMKSLLEIAGIKSYYCLVRAGEDAPNIDNKFVCSQFNHAFLMLPISKDTLYLECTNQQVPFGYNGTFTDDRDVLVIDSINSYLKHTNVYGKEKNKIINSFSFKVSNQMDCNVLQKSSYIGVATEDVRYLMLERPEKQRENVLSRFQLRQVKITSLNYVEQKDILPIITESVEYNVSQIAQVTNNNTMILPFNQVTQLEDIKRVSNRKSDIVIRRDFMQIDTLKFAIPLQLNIDKLPVANSFTSAFGAYKLEVNSTKNLITFIRTIEWKKGKFKPELYTDLVQYQRKINEMDRQVLMLKAK
ncbi:MAG: DUF3857 domain-containing protein [Bacteroidales bacterium]|nr:MAG: DUF3857 domain-containing protein [Bacteroidales bacterium]